MRNDDDDIELSAEAMKALQDFYEEEQQKFINQFSVSSDEFEENWVQF